MDNEEDEIALPPPPTRPRSLNPSTTITNSPSKSRDAHNTCLPHASIAGLPSSRFPGLPLRKHARDEFSWDLELQSSDPPLFSSDDHGSTGLENYDSGVVDDTDGYRSYGTSTGSPRRKKRKYRGTWWGARLLDEEGLPPRATHLDNAMGTAERERRKRELTRNVDSGVWMGSDEIEAAIAEVNGVERVVAKTTITPSTSAQFVAALRSPAKAVGERPPPEKEAELVVQDCLERGTEVVDLSSMNLDHLPNALLVSLIDLTLQPSVPTQNYHPTHYRSLRPELQLLLSNNNLTHIPPTLYDLSTIHVLSLRNNAIQELGSGIEDLREMKTLNIAGNQLKTLPFEIVKLIQNHNLTHVTVHPNPFEAMPQPRRSEEPREAPETPHLTSPEDSASETSRSKYDLKSLLGSTAPLFLARSSITHYTPHGTPSTSKTSKTTTQPHPSLLDLTLRKTASHLPTQPSPTYLASLSLPPHLTTLLHHAHSTTTSGPGLYRCTACSTEMLFPAARWLEWWDISVQESGSGSGGRTEADCRRIRVGLGIEDVEGKDGAVVTTAVVEEEVGIPFWKVVCGRERCWGEALDV